jgi:PTS system mannose-specific IID component
MQKRVNRLDIMKIILRSFFLQASWCFERMQSLGLVFALLPILQKLYGYPEECVKASVRHLQFFNTHPYFASFILGTIARMEEKRSQTGSPSEEEIMSFRTAVSGPYAAIGDAFFWSALRPFASALSLLCLTFGSYFALIGPIVFLIFYNLFHLTARILGVIWGYFHEEETPQKIQQLNLVGLATTFKHITLPILGVLAILRPSVEGILSESHTFVMSVCSLILVLFFSKLNRLGRPMYWQVIILFLVSMVLAYNL